MSKPLDHCLERLHLKEDTKLRERAEYYLGECMNKVPSKIFDKGPNCQLVISIQLAYESLGQFGWDTTLAAELAICSQKAYESTLTIVKKHLGLQTIITFETLGVTFGSTTLSSHAHNIWSYFIEKYLSSLGPAQQISVKEQLQQPVWKAATFYVCSRAVGISIDKEKLQKTCICSSKEFNKSVKLLQKECSSKLDDLKSTTKSKRKAINVDEEDEDNTTEIKRKKKKSSTIKKVASSSAVAAEESTSTNRNNAESSPIKPKIKTAISGIVSMIDGQDYRTSIKYANYQLWEKQMKQRLINN